MEAKGEPSVPRIWQHIGGENLKAVFKAKHLPKWVIRFTRGFWTVFEGRHARFYAWSSGLTPFTVQRGEWVTNDASSTLLSFNHVRCGSFDDPLPLGHIGEDFFIRNSPKSPVWFTLNDGKTTIWHSATKKIGTRPGMRYCSICCKMSSSNNFVSQHLPMHARVKNTVTTLEDVRAALWLADATGNVAQKKNVSVRKRA